MNKAARFLLCAAAILWVAPAAARWPERPVKIVLPSPPGSSSDAIARALAEKLSSKWGQPVVIENKPGGGTVIATEAVAKAQPDGYTLGWIITAHSINATLQAHLPYDPVADFAGVTLLYQLKAAIVANPGLPVSTVDELVHWVRAQGHSVSYASPGIGTGPQLLAEIFRLTYGLDMQHVAYKGTGQAYPDVLAGRVPLEFDALPNALPLARAGKLKILAVVSDEPVPGEPGLPILAGLLPHDAMVGWNGLVVPRRTPRALVARLSEDIAEAVRSPEIQAVFARYTVQTLTSTPQQFDEFIRTDIGRWADVIRRSRISIGN
jgi:tripartite-type tricarboxylate transporter receptor subunit TctC